MSESDFSKIPPLPPHREPLPANPAELRAAIIELRGELKAQRARETLEGEIVRINPDGTARIRTERGEVTVAPPRGRDLPPEGTKVEIEILPGAPPRQALIRPAPETAPQEQPAPEKPAAAPTRPPAATREPAGQQQQNPPPQEQAGTPAPKTPSVPAAIPGQAPRLAAQTAQSLSGGDTPAAPAPPPAILKPGDALRLRLAPALPPPETTANPVSPPQPAPEQPATAPPPAPQNTDAQPQAQQITLHILPGEPPNAAPAPPPPVVTQNHPVPAKTAIATPVITPQTAATAPTETGSDTPSLPPQTAPAEKTGTPLPPATPPAPLPDTLDIRITAILPPDPPPATKAGELPPEEEKTAAPLIATIADSGSERHPPTVLIRLPGEPAVRRFALPFPAANLPPGTRIEFRTLPAAAPAPENPAVAAATAATPPLPAFAAGPPPPGYIPWPAFEELAQTLQQAAPQAAQTLAGTVPNPAAPARLPAAALFFIAAVRSGDMAGWLGEKTSDTLRRIGKDDLPARLLRDSGSLQPRTAADPPGEWRSASLPLLWDGHPHRLSLHYRGEESENGEEGNDKKSATRFIFDLSLRRLGAVQLDGLHRENRIDLTVRTAAALGAPMQQTMRRRYSRALEGIGLSGDLSFQNKPEFFVKIAPSKTGRG